MRSGGESRRDGLGVLVAGLPEMRVQIDEPRRDDDAGGLDAVGLVPVEPRHGLQDPVDDDQLAGPFASVGGVDQPDTAEVEIGHLAAPASR